MMPSTLVMLRSFLLTTFGTLRRVQEAVIAALGCRTSRALNERPMTAALVLPVCLPTLTSFFNE
jgi:hypothetical protein